MNLSIWEELINEGVISDEDFIKYYYVHFHKWDSLQKDLITKYSYSNTITTLINMGIVDDLNVKKVVIERFEHCRKHNAELVDKVLTELSHDIIKQKLDSQLDENIPLLASNNKYKGYSLFKNDTLVKFDERDLIDGKYEIPEGITTIGKNAFMRCYKLKSVEIPSSVTHIGECSFSICKNLEEIVIPSSVTNIDSACFFACINLTELKLPQQLTHIPTLLCFDCKKLTKVTLSSKVSYIARDAFLLCEVLEDINIPQALQEDWNNNKFKSMDKSSKKIIKTILQT